MGIPKFYRWISERYPCLSEKIREYQIPEFDNLYLDMNGIIHSCSHPNDDDIHLRIPEKNIFKDIFNYIDFLFKMIKPRKVFFLAVDGVAPRAKMNQQRGRRFRSAKDAKDQEAEALRKGENLPSEDRFDSNCITPGTEFMARLHAQLKYFIKVKLSTDPIWQKEELTVYLSGHDVPGEGEHKIMDFIRHIRSKTNYDADTRHCLYGLDADLMMLGLSTHELRFSLLREEVKFSRPKKKQNNNNNNKNKSKGGDGGSSSNQNNMVNYDLKNISIFKSKLPEEILNACNDDEKIELKSNDMSTVNSNVSTSTNSFANVAKLPPVPLQKIEPTETGEKELIPESDEKNPKGTYKAPMPEKTTFLLLHLSLMRDYIDEEFVELKNKLENHPTIKYDLECIIDDWILMNILVGNDFVPHLPNLHIVRGALPSLYKTYMNILPTFTGYLNESGILNLERFQLFLQEMSKFDLEVFRETYDDMKYMSSKSGKNIVLGDKMFEDFDFGGAETEDFEEEELEPGLKALIERSQVIENDENKENDELDFEVVPARRKQKKAHFKEDLCCKDIFTDADDFFDDEDSEEFRLEFYQSKKNYYITKMELETINKETLLSFAQEYVKAIQWILLYYYKGVSSWNWYYPSHYAPYTSDIKGISKFEIKFDLAKPFRPFEQLLGVLPAHSKKFLPICFQRLMIEKESPIIDYYPQDFVQDLNGKKQDWEAVVLIPFINEFRLVQAMDDVKALTEEEEFRNSKGTIQACSYSTNETGPVHSPEDMFPLLKVSHVNVEEFADPQYDPLLLPKGIHPNAKSSKIYQGFPTLKSLEHTNTLEKAEVKVFDFLAKEESLLIELKRPNIEKLELEDIAKEYLGRTCWVNWPHLNLALIVGVSDENTKIKLKYQNQENCKETISLNTNNHELIAKGLVERHLKYKGIKIGKVEIILWAKMMEGRKVHCNREAKVQFDVQWGKIEQPFPMQTSIFDENVTEIFFLDKEVQSYQSLFPIGSKVFSLTDPCFGALGQVEGYDESKKRINVKFTLVPKSLQPNLTNKLGQEGKSLEYLRPEKAAQICQISTYALSRITGSIYVEYDKENTNKKSPKKKQQNGSKNGKKMLNGIKANDSSSDSELSSERKKINVGLDLKFNKKNLEVRGYSRKTDGYWSYSSKAVKLVKDYVTEFPEFVRYLEDAKRKGLDNFEASHIFKNDPEGELNKMKDWLDERGVRDFSRISSNSFILDDEDIEFVWSTITEMKSKETRLRYKSFTMKPHLLYKPGIDRGCVAPFKDWHFELLDRVIIVDPSASIPLGQLATVVGIQEPSANPEAEKEELFKSTSGTSLLSLIVLADPNEGIFDKKQNKENTQERKSNTLELTTALVSLLKIHPEKNFGSWEEKKPKLVKLYPYQVINLSESEKSDYHEEQRNGISTNSNPFTSIPRNPSANYNNYNQRQQQPQQNSWNRVPPPPQLQPLIRPKSLQQEKRPQYQVLQRQQQQPQYQVLQRQQQPPQYQVLQRQQQQQIRPVPVPLVPVQFVGLLQNSNMIQLGQQHLQFQQDTQILRRGQDNNEGINSIPQNQRGRGRGRGRGQTIQEQDQQLFSLMNMNQATMQNLLISSSPPTKEVHQHADADKISRAGNGGVNPNTRGRGRGRAQSSRFQEWDQQLVSLMNMNPATIQNPPPKEVRQHADADKISRAGGGGENARGSEKKSDSSNIQMTSALTSLLRIKPQPDTEEKIGKNPMDMKPFSEATSYHQHQAQQQYHGNVSQQQRSQNREGIQQQQPTQRYQKEQQHSSRNQHPHSSRNQQEQQQNAFVPTQVSRVMTKDKVESPLKKKHPEQREQQQQNDAQDIFAQIINKSKNAPTSSSKSSALNKCRPTTSSSSSDNTRSMAPKESKSNDTSHNESSQSNRKSRIAANFGNV